MDAILHTTSMTSLIAFLDSTLSALALDIGEIICALELLKANKPKVTGRI